MHYSEVCVMLTIVRGPAYTPPRLRPSAASHPRVAALCYENLYSPENDCKIKKNRQANHRHSQA